MAIISAPETAQEVRWFHALSDETRLEIIQLLSHGERCVCELTGALDAAQSRLSFHLKTLKDAGLVTDRREGRWVYYALNPDAFEGVAAFATDVMKAGRRARARGGACCG